MNTATLLAELTARGVEFRANGDKLSIRPADRLTSDELVIVRQHKPVILKLLRSEGRETAPIVPGSEHFNLYVDPDAAHWPEFVPGHHVDVRQPSRLRGLLAPRHDQDQKQ